MRRSGLKRGGLLTAAAVMGANAAAAEVVLSFGVEQRLETGWNTGLSVADGGQTTTSLTTLSFGAVSRTALDVLEFNASTALLAEDSEDGTGTGPELARPDLTFRYTREVPNALFSVGAQYRQDDVDAFDDDLAEEDLGGTRTDLGADLRLETGRTAPLGFAFTTSFSRTEYQDTTDPDLTDTDTVRVGIEAQLRFSEVVQGRLGLNYEREDETAVPGPATEAVTASFGLSYTLANGSANADLSFGRDDDIDRTTLIIGRTLTLPAASLSARLGVTESEVGGTDLIGGVSWSQELPRGTLDLQLERRVDLDDDTDESVAITTFSLAVAQDLNDVSSMGLTLSHEISDEPSERIELSQFAATYRYSLTDDWDLNSGLRYRVRHDADGRAASPDLFVSLSRRFDLRP